MHILYKLTFASGKSYIGQTIRTMRTRLAQHRRSAMNGNSHLPVHCAWRKHGEPVVEIIGEFNSDDELHRAEIESIASCGALAPGGYNVAYGGETAPSKNPDVAAKIAAKAIGRKNGNTLSISEASKLHWADDEYRKKVSLGLKASWTDERRQAAGERSRLRWGKLKEEGWTMPVSTKEKLRNKVVSEDTRKRMSDAAKGKPKPPRSNETRQKLSEAAKNSWSDDEHSKRRAKAISDAQLKRHANMSDAQKEEFRNIRMKAWETRRKLKSIQCIEK